MNVVSCISFRISFIYIYIYFLFKLSRKICKQSKSNYQKMISWLKLIVIWIVASYLFSMQIGWERNNEMEIQSIISINSRQKCLKKFQCLFHCSRSRSHFLFLQFSQFVVCLFVDRPPVRLVCMDLLRAFNIMLKFSNLSFNIFC